MTFIKKHAKTACLTDTSVENIFINDYMVSAPGDYVKIYLLTLMYTDLDRQASRDDIAKTLRLSPEDVDKAWDYWEKQGVVRKKGDQREFVVLKEQLYGHKTEDGIVPGQKAVSSLLENEELKSMYKTIEKTIGRLLSGTELTEIIDWIEENGATPEVVAQAYAYCAANKKDNVRYVGTVVKSWASRGLTSVLDVEKYLNENDQRHYVYKRVMQALGFARNATEEERRIIDSWTEKMGYDINDILEACKKTSGIPNPNINYINKVLINRNNGKNQSIAAGAATVKRYYEQLREKAADAAYEKTKEVYKKVPAIREIDEEIKECSIELSKVMISDRQNKKEQIKKLKEEGESLTKARAVMLTENGFPIDYMETHYLCGLCKDTGTKDSGEQCVCFPKRAEEAKQWIKEKK